VRLYREATPLEEYLIKGRKVFVKREDLYGIAPAPPLGKLRGLRSVLRGLDAQKVRLVGCWDTRVSRLGEGLAAACREIQGMRALVSYPTRKGTAIPASILAAKSLGADVLPLRGNHVGICYAQARAHVEARGGRMLPFGLECSESVQAVAETASHVPPDVTVGTIVLCCGSGVTLAGLLTGLKALPGRLVGISSGRSIAKIRACVNRYVPEIPACVELRAALMPYDSTPSIECPFPSHPNYDLKAWQFVDEHIEELKAPVLFWNIGA